MSQKDRAPFPLLEQLPDALRGVILKFHWDVSRLRALDLPERELEVADLVWHFELPFWALDGRPFQLSPEEVLTRPHRYANQWHRTTASDLGYPLDGYVGPGGRVTVLDGVHRLLKAHVLGRQTVRLRLLQESDFDAIAVPTQQATIRRSGREA